MCTGGYMNLHMQSKCMKEYMLDHSELLLLELMNNGMTVTASRHNSLTLALNLVAQLL